MYIVDFSQMLGVWFGEFYLCSKVMTTTIPCVDALQNCDQYNYTLICDKDGIYATWAKQNCRAYCGYCTGKIILKSKFFLVKKIKCGIWPRRHQLSLSQKLSFKSEVWPQINALFFKGFKLRNELRDLKNFGDGGTRLLSKLKVTKLSCERRNLSRLVQCMKITRICI